ncbi:ATP-binding protein [Tateyamaria sp. SN6-1]|uniref:sensor histidine kinase n=1 Tax=Tateyamaria sp. SN6-1 TaxID=3092148 RepID=UPI0039F48CFC
MTLWPTFDGMLDRLGVRLVVASLIVGSVLSVFSTGLQLGTSFLRQRSDATAVLTRIEDALTTSLEQAVWTFNFAQVDIILDGLATDPNLSYIQLSTPTGQLWTRGAQDQADETIDAMQTYDLIHQFENDRSEVVGTLLVHLSLDAVRARLWAEFLTTFLTNLAKAYLAALALLIIVERMIIRHLRRISEHVDAADAKAAGPLMLDRPPRGVPDSLDKITGALLGYERRTLTQIDALHREVTEREKAETEAKRALSIRSNFLATMSHEIRTPLNAIMGFLHLIANYRDISDKPKLYAETATRASHQLMGLMNNTLDMSRIEANAVDIHVSPTDLRVLANQWLTNADATRHMRDKQIDISVVLDDDLPEQAEIDAPHVTQVVANLVDNAIKFTDHGKVQIRLSMQETAAGRALDIIVSDTGTGIDDEARSRIFDRFTQADTGIRRGHGGSGLGLAISRELARLMNGDLRLLESERDGFKTSFLLRLNNLTWVDQVT